MTEPRQLLTFAQAAGRAAVSVKTLRREIARGKLAYVRVGHRGVRIDAGDLARYIDAGRCTVQEEGGCLSTSPRGASTGTTRSRRTVLDFEAARAARRARTP